MKHGLSSRAAKMAAGQQLPIDIHYNKLLDWLIDRRHCNLRWASEAKEGKERLQQALAQLPSHPAELKEASRMGELGLNYFNVVKVTEVLKGSEEDGVKNVFGQFSSQRMKVWLEIQKQYEKQNIYLAECANILMRSVNYEIPAVKRQIAKAQQLQKECDKKEADCELSAKTSRERYQAKCREMGIKGDHPKRELLHLVDELPQTLQGVAEQTKTLEPVADFYHKFSHYVRGESSQGPLLGLLRHVMAKGNTSVFEWRTGASPPSVENTVALGCLSSTSDNQTVEPVATDDVIDFGEDIDFSEIITLEESGITVSANGFEDGITVETTGDGTHAEAGDFGIVMETSDENVSSVDPSELMTVLEATNTRSLFLDDLSELQSFLTQRVEEYSRHDDQLHLDLFDESTPLEVRRESLELLREMREKVDVVEALLTSAKMTQLFLIRSSPTYVDRVVDSLQYHMRQANKAVTMATTYAAKRDEAIRLQSTSAPKLAQLVKETKELQAQVAMEISKRYNNRVVNIIGEINLI